MLQRLLSFKYGVATFAAQEVGHCDQGDGYYVKRRQSRRPRKTLGNAEKMNTSAKMEQLEVLRVKLAVLKREHRDLDEAIHALQERGSTDMLMVRRLKKQKLAYKDQIAQLEDRILPDIIA